MKKSQLFGTVCAGVLSMLTCTSNAALIGVLPATPGGTDWQAYYDDLLDITWAANANMDSSGSWDSQVAWAAGLTLGGVSGWRLPSADVNGDNIVIDCTGGGVAGCSDNELGFLFWEEGISTVAPDPFTGIQSGLYWTGTEFATSSAAAWSFFFGRGSMHADAKNLSRLGWAVHSGNAALIPLPAAVWLFGSGLLGLLGIAGRKIET